MKAMVMAKVMAVARGFFHCGIMSIFQVGQDHLRYLRLADGKTSSGSLVIVSASTIISAIACCLRVNGWPVAAGVSGVCLALARSLNSDVVFAP
jgi:hypothetical protein